MIGAPALVASQADRKHFNESSTFNRYVPDPFGNEYLLPSRFNRAHHESISALPVLSVLFHASLLSVSVLHRDRVAGLCSVSVRIIYGCHQVIYTESLAAKGKRFVRVGYLSTLL